MCGSLALSSIRTGFAWVMEFCSVLFKRIKYKMASIFLIYIIHFSLFSFCFIYSHWTWVNSCMVKNDRYLP